MAKMKLLCKKELELLKNGWTIDSHSTLLSRKMSRHCICGNKRYTKIIKKGIK